MKKISKKLAVSDKSMTVQVIPAEPEVTILKKYNVIYADPAWPVKKIKRASRPNQIEMDYPTMTIEEIKALNVADIADKNAHLFLWTTQSYLPYAFDVMKA